MSHGATEHPNPNLHDDPRSSPLVLGAVLGVILTVVTILCTVALYYAEDSVLRERVAAQANASVVEQLKAEQNLGLQKLEWVDPKERKAVRVPIDLAMKIVAAEAAKKPTASAPASN
ncbi:MAG: hypothetical protein HZB38_09520 [Planctomycetes bacterium]|nr:hypothetical protein [Planctomycetota bacterium]